MGCGRRRRGFGEKHGRFTYHAGSVAAAEVAISVRGLARAVGAPLVAAVAGTASVAGVDVGDRSTDGNGGHDGEDDSGDLHFGKGLVKKVGDVCVVGVLVLSGRLSMELRVIEMDDGLMSRRRGQSHEEVASSIYAFPVPHGDGT